MNEIDLINVFYQTMKAQGKKHDEVFLSIDEDLLAQLKLKFGSELQLKSVEKLADICIANEWLERTTADPHYHYLSLTPAGLQMAILMEYSQGV